MAAVVVVTMCTVKNTKIKCPARSIVACSAVRSWVSAS